VLPMHSNSFIEPVNIHNTVRTESPSQRD
jgi:hypothetical protein